LEARVPDLVRIDALPALDPGGRTVVPLPLSAHDRRRVRRRLDAGDGTVLELALPTGTELAIGQVLHATATAAYVVAAADEQVIVVRPRDRAEAARLGHLVGNLHRDLDVDDDGTLVALHDGPLEARLRAAGCDLVVALRPFRGRAPDEHAH
jgi:urease accessory protein